jgi:3-hydroxy acid dehydrogenase / malonic semialdehyde reductase
MTDLSDRRVLLTGGSTGIGRETLRLLTQAGARVLTFARDPKALQEAIDQLDDDARIKGLAADITRRDDVATVFGAVDEWLGGLEILVACAALGAEPIHEMDDNDWRYVVETNLVGNLACARQAIARMIAAGGGHILLVGSIAIDIKKPGESVYAATKAGIQAFAETLRKELADSNIKVSVVQPGSVATDMQECTVEEKAAATAKGEMLHAAQVAEAIEFVLTRAADVDIVNLRIEPRLQKTA